MSKKARAYLRNCFGLGFLLTLAMPCFGASAPSAEAIVRTGEQQMRGSSTQALMTMKIVRPSFTRELALRVWTRGTKNAMVAILKPAKEKGVTSLRNDSQMWNFLPKTDQIVRVPTSLMLQSWMGSDFTNDDLMKMSSMADDYTHKVLKKETKDGEKSVLIECLPKPNAPVVWGKILYWARQSDSLPVREEYYDEMGKLVRTMTLQDFQKRDDRVIPTRLTITKADSDEKTTVTYEKILFDRELDDGLFRQDNLKNVSRNGLDTSNGWLSQAMPKSGGGA
jgi:outer membrane lipoprotein-sorting protein